MTGQDFEVVRRLLAEESAIALDPGKEYLVEARLTPLVRELKLNSIGELLGRVRQDQSNGLGRRIVEAMVTTESSFFRDQHPFQALRQTVLPELIHLRREERRLQIWCAASSFGQEPYSIAILIREHFPELADWKVTLLASDISREVLERARQARYNQIEVNRGLPAALLVKYFEQQGTHWQLKPTIREMVTFTEINLAKPWPFLPQMDLIVLRNVMIYFDVPTKKIILEKASGLLRAGGYLLLGSAETTFNIDDSYRRVETIRGPFYQQVKPG
jgi:chemotaxis protein methyltransferase CheR